MARQGGKIEPNLELKRYGLEDGFITITPDGVSISLDVDEKGHCPGRTHQLLHGHDDCYCPTMMINPEFAPLFRMVANRLDEIAGKRVKK